MQFRLVYVLLLMYGIYLEWSSDVVDLMKANSCSLDKKPRGFFQQKFKVLTHFVHYNNLHKKHNFY